MSSTAAVEAATSLMSEIKFWPEMKTKETKTAKATKNKQKQTSQKNSIIHGNIKMVQILL